MGDLIPEGSLRDQGTELREVPASRKFAANTPAAPPPAERGAQRADSKTTAPKKAAAPLVSEQLLAQPLTRTQTQPKTKSYSRPASLLTSLLVHGLALLALSFWLFPMQTDQPEAWLDGAFSEAAERIDFDDNDLATVAGEITMTRQSAQAIPLSENLADTNSVVPSNLVLPTTTVTSTQTASLTNGMSQPLASRGGGLDGRKGHNRSGIALASGGTAASEAAVERGLGWLAAHQLDNGSWHFNLHDCPQCAGACRHSGFRTSTTDSTGLALLCFLGAGYTQDEGPYQETVAKGLYYLQSKMITDSFGGDLQDRSIVSHQNGDFAIIQKNGDMYSHAIATLTLCEAYAMTRDKNLAATAQKAVDFTVYAQHDQGGWKYHPKEPGDLSVTGWQLTSLKSASHAKLKIPRSVWYKVSNFLDGVQGNRGATYGYESPATKESSMSAVGLFSRMMLGWPHDHPPLAKGIAKIAEQDPRKKDMYFNYYASQVLRHYGGSGWKRWNPRMRDYLVKLQATQGHETGSWYIDENWSDRGGRLYTTTLAILTLEVYYRYMPMYQETFTNGGR